MTRRIATLTIACFVLVLPLYVAAAEHPLSHVVFFKLKENTPANREKLVAGCQQYLTKHEGMLYFATGVLAEDFTREVNDRDFDVSLIMVFRDKEAHDKYQSHPRHDKFVEEFQGLWSGVRVFDAYLHGPQESAAPAAPTAQPKAAAAGDVPPAIPPGN